MGLSDRDYMREPARRRATNAPEGKFRPPAWSVILAAIVVAAILLRSC